MRATLQRHRRQFGKIDYLYLPLVTAGLDRVFKRQKAERAGGNQVVGAEGSSGTQFWVIEDLPDYYASRWLHTGTSYGWHNYDDAYFGTGAQTEDGYLDTYYQINGIDKRWTNLRDDHEMYVAGHMLEGAIAYFEATGKRKFLISLPFGLIWSIAVHNWYPFILTPALGYFLMVMVATFYAGVISLGVFRS